MKLELLSDVGQKTVNLLAKINILSVEDLLEYYPYRYNYIKFMLCWLVVEF